jgi:hypothetical protein
MERLKDGSVVVRDVEAESQTQRYESDEDDADGSEKVATTNQSTLTD